MTQAATISSAMHACLKHDVARAHATSAAAMDLAINHQSVYPLSTMTQTIKFTIQPHGETKREFVFVATLTEQSTPDNAPTAGWTDAT